MVATITGWLKPSGEFIEVQYALHDSWAEDECKRIGNDAWAPAEAIRDLGYFRVTDGYVFSHNTVKMNGKQLSWLIENIRALDLCTNEFAREGLYGEVDLPPADPIPGVHSDLITPSY